MVHKVKTLDAREQWVITQRFGLMDGQVHTLKEIADQLKMPAFALTQEEIEQLTTFLLSLREGQVPEDWRAQILPPPYKPQGQFGEIVDRYQCLTCHTINGSGGTLAPDLSVAGSRMKEGYISDYMRHPTAVRPLLTERMPPFGLTVEEAQVVEGYLRLVLVDDSVKNSLLPAHPAGELVNFGEHLFFEEYSCHACHTIGESGGYYGPDLNFVGDRLEPGYVYAQLLDPQRFDPLSREPNLGISEEHALALTAFLMTKKVRAPNSEVTE